MKSSSSDEFKGLLLERPSIDSDHIVNYLECLGDSFRRFRNSHDASLRSRANFGEEVLSKYLVSLSEADRVGDVIALREIFKEAITGFEPEEDIVDIIYTQMKD